MTRRSALAILALVACGCADGPSPREGTTRVLLTDAPFPYDEVVRANIHIARVAATQVGGTVEQTIVSPRRSYDLVALQHGRTADLGEVMLAPGVYDRVVVEVDLDHSSITLKNGVILTSNSTPGIRWSTTPNETGRRSVSVLADGPLEVTDDGATLVIDFDLGRSFRPVMPGAAAAGFRLAPSLRATNGAATGSIVGTVVGQGGGPLPDATVSLYVVQPSASPGSSPTLVLRETARTDAAGRFRIAHLSAGRAYSIAAEGSISSDFGATTPTDITVMASTETSVGTLVVPRFDASSVPGTYVLRRAGPPENSREVPIRIWAPAEIMLVADTLRLDATGGGSEVWVDRRSDITPPLTRTSASTLTYSRRGRVFSIAHTCQTVGCSPLDAVIDGDLLTLSGSGSLILPSPASSPFFPWPRVYERVGR